MIFSPWLRTTNQTDLDWQYVCVNEEKWVRVGERKSVSGVCGSEALCESIKLYAAQSLMGPVDSSPI